MKNKKRGLTGHRKKIIYTQRGNERVNISSGAQILINSGKRMQNSTLSGAVGHRMGVLSFDDILAENVQ